jgi:hypothetical protein
MYHLFQVSGGGSGREEQNFEAKMMRVPPSLLDPLAEQTAVMSGLDKFTDYNISVLCFTDPGDGVRRFENIHIILMLMLMLHLLIFLKCFHANKNSRRRSRRDKFITI